MMHFLWQDTRYAFRSLVRQPGFAIPAILTLALGIGVNTAMFTVLNAVMLHPSTLRAWRDPAHVLTLWETNSHLSAIFADQLPVRLDTYRAWKRQSHSFETLAAWRDLQVTVTGAGPIEHVQTGAATIDLFQLIGVRPRVGRNFLPAEMQPGHDQVAVLSDEFHRSRFGGRDSILGTTMLADGKPLTIVGVLPAGVAFPDLGPGSDVKRPKFWTPLSLLTQPKENEFNLLVFGRIRSGSTQTAARSEMAVIESRVARERKEDDGTGMNIVPLLDTTTDSDTRRALLILQIAVAFVLLIACANAGNLLLTRTIARDKELAIRSAMGAGNFRLMRQTFTESALLTLASAVLGVVFAFIGLRILSSWSAPGLAGLQDAGVDRYVLAFTAAAALLTAVLFALVPAYYSLRNARDLSRSSRASTAAPHRLRGALAVLEIAMSLVLVIGAGLLIRSLSALIGTGVGFNTEHLLVMRPQLPDPAYSSPEKLYQLNSRLLQSVRSLKGVERAALTTGLALKALSQSTFEIPGRPKDPKKLPVTNWARVSDDYFETLGLQLIQGRTLNRAEVAAPKTSAAVVNQAFVDRHFPGERALDKLVVFGDDSGVQKTWRIVGVVSNERQMGPDNEQGPELYLPASHLHDFLLVARTTGEPAQLANAFRQQVASIGKDVLVAELESEEAALNEWLAPRRFNMVVLLAFAGIAILLAAAGLYSVLAYTVTLRTREIGIRVAVGATPMNIRAHILRGGFKLSLAGVVIGLGAALAVTRFMESLIYGVKAIDPLTFVTVASLVLVIAVAASYLPAMRAAKIDPVEALRAE